MSIFTWDEGKNKILKRERGVSFEDISFAIENGGLIMIDESPSTKNHPGQLSYVVLFKEYVYVVPYVKTANNKVFLKTIFPSRKLNKQYN